MWIVTQKISSTSLAHTYTYKIFCLVHASEVMHFACWENSIFFFPYSPFSSAWLFRDEEFKRKRCKHTTLKWILWHFWIRQECKQFLDLLIYFSPLEYVWNLMHFDFFSSFSSSSLMVCILSNICHLRCMKHRSFWEIN